MTASRKVKLRLGIILCVLMAFSGCGDKGSKQQQPAAQPKKKVEQPQKVAAASMETGAHAQEPAAVKFVYNAEGRRDPFLPMILVKRPVDAGEGQFPLTPLQQYETQQYKLTAVIIGYGEPLAMLNTPDGKSYIVRKGTKIGKNGGKVTRITADTVQVEEKYKDLMDAILTNLVEIKLPKREGV